MRFLDWLRAKPWPHRGGWRYRALYRAHREPDPRWPDRYPGCGRARAAWRALSFPHTHNKETLEAAREALAALREAEREEAAQTARLTAAVRYGAEDTINSMFALPPVWRCRCGGRPFESKPCPRCGRTREESEA
jgi:rubrerythrin